MIGKVTVLLAIFILVSILYPLLSEIISLLLLSIGTCSECSNFNIHVIDHKSYTAIIYITLTLLSSG